MTTSSPAVASLERSHLVITGATGYHDYHCDYGYHDDPDNHDDYDYDVYHRCHCRDYNYDEI